MQTLSRQSVGAAFMALALTGCATAPVAPSEQRFVAGAPEQAAAIWTSEDEFMAVVTPADISIRTRSPEVSRPDLLRVYAGAFEQWNAEERARLEAMFARRAAQLQSIQRWLPDTVYLFKSNGAADTLWPHTRANAINMGTQLAAQDHALDSLFFHELFHVLSRHSATRRDEMYALIGFAPCAIVLPPEVQARTLTNPDAPFMNWAAPIEGGRYVFTALFANPSRFDSSQQNFGGYLHESFLEASRGADGRCGVSLRDGQPVEVPRDQATAAYYAGAGHNTEYVFHPEEILADNFSELMMGESASMPNPEVHQRLAAFLGIAYPQAPITTPPNATGAPGYRQN